MSQVIEKYIVLRDLALDRTAAPVEDDSTERHLPGRDRASDTSQSIPSLETHDLAPADVEEVARQTDVRAIARPMAVSLIEPARAQAEDEPENDAWGIAAVKADECSCSGEGVVVAVLDTGIDPNHAAFAGMEIEQKDFTDEGLADVSGHGPHCAATIFGRDVNGRRIGVARGVKKALIGKVVKAGSESGMLFEGLKWASSNNADIISMSVAFDFNKTVEDNLADGYPVKAAASRALESYRANLRMLDKLMEMIHLQQAFGSGSMVVAAAGNDNMAHIDPRFTVSVALPAAAEHVIAVSALRRSAAGLTMWPSSNINPQLSAPGHNVLSARGGSTHGLALMSGTSMACPHVAGVAALWWEWLRKSDITPTPQIVAARLLASVTTTGFAPGVPAFMRGFGLATAPA
jgi:subtilisin family serine protease